MVVREVMRQGSNEGQTDLNIYLFSCSRNTSDKFKFMRIEDYYELLAPRHFISLHFSST